MKSMLMHSFVLDALETTGADTFSHFEVLIDEHIRRNRTDDTSPRTTSRLQQLVPTVGVFHTRLPLRRAFEEYNRKHKLTKRKHITISFNEIRHILNLAQIMALAGIETNESETGTTGGTTGGTTTTTTTVGSMPDKEATSPRVRGKDATPTPGAAPTTFVGPRLITFDGDQTLYSDGANFESNRQLAHYMYLLLKHGVTVAVVTAAGYEYITEKYEYRLSGLLAYFQETNLSPKDCERFYLFGGECNYLLQVRACTR
jgi:IMP and pyridine-specific 5'-nucleotidase